MRCKTIALGVVAATFATTALAQTSQMTRDDMNAFRPERTVLYVHGATYPASTAFDLKLDGLSWMEYIAARGYDVYLLDLRGYGKSTQPKEMAEDPAANPPIVRGDTAVK